MRGFNINSIQFVLVALLGNGIITFQLIVLCRYFNFSSILALISSILLALFFQALLGTLDVLQFLRVVERDFINRYEKCNFIWKPVEKYLSELGNVDEYFKHNTIESIVREGFGIPPSSVSEDNINIIEVSIPEDEIIAGSIINAPSGCASYNNMFGGAFVFLPEPDFPLDLRTKFLVFHEIGHTLYHSNALRLEFTIMPIAYSLIIFWTPWQLYWSWTTIALFGVFIFLTIDFRSHGILFRMHQARLHSEIMADAVAVELMTDEEKYSLYTKLNTKKIKIYDNKFTSDENAIRLNRLLMRLEGYNEELDMIIAPVSNWDIYWRFLLLILLASFSKQPTYLQSIVGILLALFFIFLDGYLRRELVHRFSNIHKKINKPPLIE